MGHLQPLWAICSRVLLLHFNNFIVNLNQPFFSLKPLALSQPAPFKACVLLGSGMGLCLVSVLQAGSSCPDIHPGVPGAMGGHTTLSFPARGCRSGPAAACSWFLGQTEKSAPFGAARKICHVPSLAAVLGTAGESPKSPWPWK